MQALEEGALRQIAERHSIDYETPSPLLAAARVIKTCMSRRFAEPQERLFARIADLRDHTRLFSHLTSINPISSDQLAHVIGENQYVIVEGIAEGGAKLGVKLMTLFPPRKIECELFTDLFESARYGTTAALPPERTVGPQPQDKKRGAISWEFQRIDHHSSRMKIQSEFEVGAHTAYIRGTIDHVWLDFFENVMIDVGELRQDQKLCAPFPERRNR